MRRDTHLYWERKPVEVLIQSHISDVVGDVMAEHGLNQTQVAGSMGMSSSHFSNRLHNRTRWSVEDVYQVCRVLDVPLADVLPSMGGVFDA